jgi:hypothetical protein
MRERRIEECDLRFVEHGSRFVEHDLRFVEHGSLFVFGD